MTKSAVIRRILDCGIVAIIRADSSAQLVEATGALIAGGVDTVEVTMTTPNALQVIRDTTQTFGAKLVMGVGTVIDDITARMAVDAGAEFVVTPTVRLDVITVCRRYGKPVMTGDRRIGILLLRRPLRLLAATVAAVQLVDERRMRGVAVLAFGVFLRPLLLPVFACHHCSLESLFGTTDTWSDYPSGKRGATPDFHL